jgi:hypothetical protein
MHDRTQPLLEKPCSAVYLKNLGSLFWGDMLKESWPDGVLYGPPILRWTKPLRGRFHEVSIGNCQRRTGP